MSHDPSQPLPPHRAPDSLSPLSPLPPPPVEPADRPARWRSLGHHSDLRILRTAYRRQRRVATLAALGYFTVFLVLCAVAPGFMTADAVAGLSTGLVLGLVQIPVTWLAIAFYEYRASRTVDPLAYRIRKQAELRAERRTAR